MPHGMDVALVGIGEPGVPPFALTLANAVFATTGKPIRNLQIGSALKA